MAAAPVEVVGSTPISFTSSEGAQKVVPLSALQFSGSDLQLKAAWTALFDANETRTLLALAKARAAVGELVAPPIPPKAPAIAITAGRPGPRSNGITVTAGVETGKPPLTAKITLSAVEVDTYTGLANGAAAAMAIGVDTPTGAPGDPVAGTGVVVVKQGSTTASTKPAVPVTGTLKQGDTVDLKDASNNVVLTLKPSGDYTGQTALSYAVTGDATAFTITATYDSSKETGTQQPVTLQTLGSLPAPVAYLVSAAAPPAGAALPADGSVQLSGGGDGLPASGLLYTS